MNGASLRQKSGLPGLDKQKIEKDSLFKLSGGTASGEKGVEELGREAMGSEEEVESSKYGSDAGCPQPAPYESTIEEN